MASDSLRELREAIGYSPDAGDDDPGAGSVEALIAYKDALEDAYLADAGALDRINDLLSDPEWGVGMLEDICELVRGTGRVENPEAAPWMRH